MLHIITAHSCNVIVSICLNTRARVAVTSGNSTRCSTQATPQIFTSPPPLQPYMSVNPWRPCMCTLVMCRNVCVFVAMRATYGPCHVLFQHDLSYVAKILLKT